MLLECLGRLREHPKRKVLIVSLTQLITQVVNILVLLFQKHPAHEHQQNILAITEVTDSVGSLGDVYRLASIEWCIYVVRLG